LVENGYDTNVLTIDKNPVKIEGAKYFTFPQELNEIGNRFVNDVKYVKYIYGQRKYIRKIVKEIEPDILHGGWVLQHGFISALSGFHPFLLMPWGSDILVTPNQSSYWTKKQLIWTIRKADMITCDAEHVKQEIIRLSNYPAEKIIVFPWGIDLRKFNSRVDRNLIRKKLGWEDNIVLIMTRSFEPIYGVEYFLQALPSLCKRYKSIRILLCGDGSLRPKFEHYVSENQLKRYVHFVGYVPNDNLPYYLSAADIYISTSLSDGTSLSLLEAMAMKLPCIVTDIPANREWITDGYNGYLVPPRHVADIIEKVEVLLNNDELKRLFGERNLIIAQHRADWNKNFTKLEKIYAKLSTNY
jgi:glycosyltransferase involved in cell wall biosynthesis